MKEKLEGGEKAKEATVDKRAAEAERRQKELNNIPCLYIPNPEGAEKMILYFHNDTEDLG